MVDWHKLIDSFKKGTVNSVQFMLYSDSTLVTEWSCSRVFPYNCLLTQRVVDELHMFEWLLESPFTTCDTRYCIYWPFVGIRMYRVFFLYYIPQLVVVHFMSVLKHVYIHLSYRFTCVR